jgi:3'-phosphoadenosine 5'-phosphosulfate sulfotransferase (PAPS reductase)/FAD synthetase
LQQLSLYDDPQFLKDSECGIDTPVTLGQIDQAIYGTGYIVTPRFPGKRTTKYQQKMYLANLLPLEDYDKVIVLFSGGKDSTACYFKLIEMGVPVEKIELWHHDIDGGHPTRRMDWPCTISYVRAFAEATGAFLRLSWRQNGFWGEVYRIGASYPVQYEDGDIKTCRLSKLQIRSQELREKILDSEELREYGYRMKFPAKSADLNTRWCSAYLKIMVGESVIRNLEEFNELREVSNIRHKFPAKSGCHQGRWCSSILKASVQDSVTANAKTLNNNIKILVVSGERRGESAGRAKYNEMEIHRTNATAKNKRLVHWWRPVIDYSERDVWEVLKRHNCNPHPCYRVGWNRCSCMMCIFSLPKHWLGIKELFPHHFDAVVQDERILGFTLDNKKTLEDYVAGADSCLRNEDHEAIRQLKTGEFTSDEIFVPEGEWSFPIGAFGGSEGGPC